MEVLLMVGSYAGQIRDVKPFYARQMIADGRALDPNREITVPEIKAPSVAVPPKPSGKLATRKPSVTVRQPAVQT